MNPKQADQLRRAIAKLITAHSDLAYAIEREPHNADKVQAHLDRCKRRLEALIKNLTKKMEI